MNRFALAILTLAIALGGPASANNISSYVNPELSTNVVAGQVSAGGVIERGSGFRVRVFGYGIYKIKFDSRYFESGCAAMVVEPTSAPQIAVVTQNYKCGGVFTVTLFALVTGKRQYGEFQFIAREDGPQNL
jgi:hypothetical protein